MPVVVPGLWVILLLIGYLGSAELRAAVRALEANPDEEPRRGAIGTGEKVMKPL
jgi:hypothetical protein